MIESDVLNYVSSWYRPGIQNYMYYRVSRTGGSAGFFLADFEDSCADSVHLKQPLCAFYLHKSFNNNVVF